MTQELLSVIEHCQGLDLFLGRPRQQEPHVCMAKIGRNQHFGDSRRAHAGVGQLVADELLQFLPKARGDAFVAMRIQLSG